MNVSVEHSKESFLKSSHIHARISFRRAPFLWLVMICAALILGTLFIAILSPQFVWGTFATDHPVAIFVGLLMGMGLLLPLLVYFLRIVGRDSLKDNALYKRFLLIVFLTGAVMRGIYLFSTPIYEDDWYRYLWDGAVVAKGVNPYLHAPAAMAPENLYGVKRAQTDDPDLVRLYEMADAEPHFTERVNYPYLTTIYPPLAQAAFAMAHQIAPFSLTSWRVVLLLFEGLTFYLLLLTLKAWGRGGHWAALYWLNPLMVYTNINVAHMDALLPPFILGALLLVRHKRPVLAAIALAGATAIKLWPLLLAPVLLREWRTDLKKLVPSVLILVILSGFALMPLLASLDANSGLSAYSAGWHKNAFLFSLLQGGLGVLFEEPGTAARLLVALIVSGVAAALFFVAKARQGARLSDNLPLHMLFIALLLFVLSPTGYPWYSIWVFILLPFVPSYGVATFAIMLPIYYTRYALSEFGYGDVFQYILTLLEFGLPLFLLIWEAVYGKRRTRTT